MNSLASLGSNSPLSNVTGGKDFSSHLLSFIRFMGDTPWYRPDLPAYVEHLKERELSGSSIRGHLASIRKAYKQIKLNRDIFYELFPNTENLPLEDYITKKKPLVDEVIARLDNALNVDVGVKSLKVQDDNFIRLSVPEAQYLLSLPDDTLSGKLDKAFMSLMLGTGIRAEELTKLVVSDLYATEDEDPCLLIREGKGYKQRKVIYGGNLGCLQPVERWMQAAGISDGIVFRSVSRHGKTGQSITVRALEYRIAKYTLMRNNQEIHIELHDLRRTYVAQQFKNGADEHGVQKNMGHVSLATTLRYRGMLGVELRRAKKTLDF